MFFVRRCACKCDIFNNNARPTDDQEVAGSTPPGLQYSFVD